MYSDTFRPTKLWVNQTGAVACQLTEYIYPGSIPMSKVNWEAKSDYEFVQNYKLLQAAFKKHQVQRYVDVEKLIRAKYQDNLEFCQWLKAFYDQSGVYREDYDPVEARSKGKGGAKVTQLLQKNASQFNSKPLPTGAGARRSTTATRPTTSGVRITTSTSTSSAPRTSASTRPSSTLQKENKPISQDAILADAQLLKKNADLSAKVQDLEATLSEVETERDFYFEKLRHVEIMLQVFSENNQQAEEFPILQDLFRVLYATAEEGVSVDDHGQLVDPAKPTVDNMADELNDLLTGDV
jgi:RP/EB family microtubule-associated protein